MRHHLLKLVPLLGVLATPAPTQDTTGNDVIRVNTRLVEIDAVVRDKNGPVKGLTKNDFTILDRGKPQKISTFNVIVAGHSGKSTPLPPGTVSNRLNSQGEEPVGATVVLWDKLNTDTQDQSYVQAQVLNYLRSLRPGDHLALYALVKNLLVVQDFTDDPDRLMKAMKRLGPEQSLNLTAADLTDLVSQINNPFFGGALADSQTMAVATAAEMTDYALKDRVYVTANSLEAIAWHMAGLPGRKKLVWISGSFPAATLDQRSRVGSTQIEIQDFGVQINKAIRKLNEANVAVYPIDPRGVVTGQSMSKNAPVGFSGGLADPAIATMLLFSKGTGGESIYGTNDLTGAMKTVMEDDEVVYSLGFYPVDQKPDGSYHPLSLKVDQKGEGRQKGLEVRHRDGYYADDPKGSNSGNRIEPINAVMASSLDATQIGITAAASPVKDRPGFDRLEVKLNANELRMEHVKDRWVSLIKYGTVFTPSESSKGSLETIQLNLTEARLRAALTDGYVFRRLVDLGDRKGTLHIVVQDVGSGFSGSVRLPLPPQ